MYVYDMYMYIMYMFNYVYCGFRGAVRETDEIKLISLLNLLLLQNKNIVKLYTEFSPFTN